MINNLKHKVTLICVNATRLNLSLNILKTSFEFKLFKLFYKTFYLRIVSFIYFLIIADFLKYQKLVFFKQLLILLFSILGKSLFFIIAFLVITKKKVGTLRRY